MIKVFLIVGFLGAGKTTLLKNLLEAYDGHKVGIIINEFGAINVDVDLIEKEGSKIAELSNGSIFCACIKDKFVDGLIEMSKYNIDYLFIEASGLADPANIYQILDDIQKLLVRNYDMEGIICVVDADNFLSMVDLLPAIEQQVKYSDIVIINKVDLVDENTMKDICTAIKSLNKDSSIIKTTYGDININEIVYERQKRYGETSNKIENKPYSYIVKSNEILPHEEFNKFLEEIASKAYRIKGFVLTDRGKYMVSVVGKNIEMVQWNKEIKETKLVIISNVGVKIVSMIIQSSKENLAGKLVI